MVTSREWTACAYAREVKGRRFVDDVLDSGFWKTCAIVVQLTEPLLRVLMIVDSDDRPAMGYLYDAFVEARVEMVRRFQRRKRVVDPYLQIVDSRWDRQLMKNLNLASYWFNPKNLTPNNEMHRRSTSGLLDVIEKYAYNNRTMNQNLTKEMGLFRNSEGDFGRRSANFDRGVMQPDEWWRTYGNSASNLQKLAIRVLSQTCSSSGCERNWSIFEYTHSKKRNRLEHQRLNDLVYVHYNLRLQQMFALKGRNYDPISFDEFKKSVA